LFGCSIKLVITYHLIIHYSFNGIGRPSNRNTESHHRVFGDENLGEYFYQIQQRPIIINFMSEISHLRKLNRNSTKK
jgi:hypothetical protein